MTPSAYPESTGCALDELVAAADALLEPARFQDYGPNGLQVQGRPQVRRLVSGVTASLALIDAAIEAGADAILVHHGLFWRGQRGTVTGWLKTRLQRLLVHDVSLLAYHLPLDAHPQVGNNAQLALRLGFRPEGDGWGRFGEQQLGFVGLSPVPDAAALAAHLEQVLGRRPLWVPGDGRPLRRIGWCSGGAQNYFEAAIAAGVDAFLTGEMSEPQAHLARECGVAFYACGHHATERYGAPALGAWLAQQLGLQHSFIEIDNPA
ncbi:MAG: Nif3-like dinuclear metal center hexameric protein [Tepidimonas sp.]|uniref:Nif3-like dinuclear metal center hexameric protein n=1 Tax=Tepidimonas sp. TaxID=2002775 RepID=UPI00298EE3D4|nr:Nif3-like dinuclear metal center hexameric protein [Tepidimonas sp.]MCS6811568.1 Nif3-like dinuclear metal center hexameric protein [Tepidimonas sp.]MDW8335829.1 Nif3-like dinuclear metal center hexameric protein [Tepidimonas sp.]